MMWWVLLLLQYLLTTQAPLQSSALVRQTDRQAIWTLAAWPLTVLKYTTFTMLCDMTSMIATQARL